MRETRLRRWTEGKYDHLRKTKLKPSAEERAARKALRIQRIRAAALRQHAEGRARITQLFRPEVKARSALTSRTSSRAIAAREYARKCRTAKARARKVRSSPLFDELKVCQLVLRWQRLNGDAEIFARIVTESLPLIDAAIRHYSPRASADFTDVRHELIIKLATLLPRYDPRRGRLFSFFILSIRNSLINAFRDVVSRRSRFILTDSEELLDSLDERIAEPEEKLESAEFEERLQALLRPSGWQWRWQWQVQGKLPLPEWQPEWTWARQGKIAA